MRNIPTKIKVEGEKEFKATLKNITAEAKSLNAEMKAVTSTFTKETTAQEKATKQTEILSRQKAVLSEKLDLLKERYGKVADAAGKNSDQAFQLKEQLNKTQADLNKVNNGLADCAKIMNDTSSEADKMKKSFKDVDGEKEFKAELKNITAREKSLNAEMKAVTSAFTKETTAQEKATKQTEVLSRQKTLLSEKLDTLKERYDKVADATGENSDQTLRLKEQINKTQAELNKVNNELADCAENMDDTSSEADKMKKSLKDVDVDKLNDGLGKVNKALIKIATASITAAAAGLASLVKQSVEAYAATEQLRGGVEKLFGSDAPSIMNNASIAFKTAGMSMNDYMETVTSFSASLISSLGGNTSKAVTYANNAIIAMADNANVFGTDIASIQNAYQGFAKQNYTMLDNLKLGYGGTKEEMERLIRDANKLSGLRLDISSFADVTKAIRIIQDKLNITGTTAKEAEETISGSLASVKSSWENLVSGMADPNADVGQLVNTMITQAGVAAKNLVPVVKTAISGIGTAIKTAFPRMSTTVDKCTQALKNLKQYIEPVVKVALKLAENMDTVVKVFVALVGTITVLRGALSIVSTVSAVSAAVSALGTAATTGATAMAGLNAVCTVNPFGAVAAALVALVGGVIAFNAAIKADAEEVRRLNVEELALSDQVYSARDAIDAQNNAMDLSMIQTASQMEYCQRLIKELDTLVDEDGKVSDAEKNRAEYILNTLNDALQTEYTLTGNQIKNYKKLEEEIYSLIEAKKANVALTQLEEQFATAVVNQKGALEDVNKAWYQYQQSLNDIDYKNATEELEKYRGLLIDTSEDDLIGKAYYGSKVLKLEGVVQAYEDHNVALHEEYLTALSNYEEYTLDMETYEAAYEAMLDENSLAVLDIVQNGRTARTEQYFQEKEDVIKYSDEELQAYLTKKEELGKAYAELIDEKEEAGNEWTTTQETQLLNAKDALETFIDTSFEEQAMAQGLVMGAAYTTGVTTGITNGQAAAGTAAAQVVDTATETAKTEAAVKGAETGTAYANATSTAIEDASQETTDAVTESLDDAADAGDKKKSRAVTVGKNMVNGIKSGIWAVDLDTILADKCYNALVAAEKKMGIQSPSKVMRDRIGKNMMAGIAVGIQQGEAGVISSVHRSMGNILDAYSHVPRSLYSQLSADSSGLEYNVNINNQTNMSNMMKSALQGVAVVMDGENMGRFVTNTVTREVYG